MADQDKYILTARLNEKSQKYFNALREHYFPVQRNFLDAHVTFFHALPGPQLGEIKAIVQRSTEYAVASPIEFGPAYSLGNGVAIPVLSNWISVQREIWRKELMPMLTRQDQASKKLHVTIQNKVSSEIAKRTMNEIRKFNPPTTWITGYDLHLYKNGPWHWAWGQNLIEGCRF